MYLIYWTQIQNNINIPQSQEFALDQLSEALTFAEALRARRREGEQLSHITMASENPNSVGQAGVAEPLSSYAWRKRR